MGIDFNSQVAGISATRRTKRNNFNTKMSPSRAATRAGNCGSGQQSALKGKPPMRQSGRRRTGTDLPAGPGEALHDMQNLMQEYAARASGSAICPENPGLRALGSYAAPQTQQMNAPEPCDTALPYGRRHGRPPAETRQ